MARRYPRDGPRGALEQGRQGRDSSVFGKAQAGLASGVVGAKIPKQQSGPPKVLRRAALLSVAAVRARRARTAGSRTRRRANVLALRLVRRASGWRLAQSCASLHPLA